MLRLDFRKHGIGIDNFARFFLGFESALVLKRAEAAERVKLRKSDAN